MIHTWYRFSSPAINVSMICYFKQQLRCGVRKHANNNYNNDNTAKSLNK